MAARQIGLVIGALLVAAFAVLRVTNLETLPDGFYIDEAGEAGNILCLAESGQSFHREPMPLYATGPSGGKLSPVFVYLEAGWTEIVGTSIASIRMLPALWNLVGLVGLFFLGRMFAGNVGGGLAVLAGIMSPWSLISSRVAWDQSLAAAPTIWGLYLLLRAKKIRDFALAGIIMALATYCYQAARVQIALLSAAALVFKLRRRELSWGQAVGFFAAAVAVSVPQILFVLSPQGRARFNHVSIFASDYLAEKAQSSYLQLARIFIGNVFLHLDPKFLFVQGDVNLRHSLATFGQVGYLEFFAIAVAAPVLMLRALISRKWPQRPPLNSLSMPDFKGGVIISIAGILSGVMPASLTWDSLPHGLRSGGAWPFFALLSAVLLSALIHWRPRLMGMIVLIVACSFAWRMLPQLYMHDGSKVRSATKNWFDAEVVDAARSATTPAEWETAIKRYSYYARDAWTYHIMHFGGQTCEGSRQLLLKSLGP